MTNIGEDSDMQGCEPKTYPCINEKQSRHPPATTVWYRTKPITLAAISRQSHNFRDLNRKAPYRIRVPSQVGRALGSPYGQRETHLTLPGPPVRPHHLRQNSPQGGRSNVRQITASERTVLGTCSSGYAFAFAMMRPHGPPGALRGLRLASGGAGTAEHRWRGGEPIISGNVELLDEDRAVSLRNVSCGGGAKYALRSVTRSARGAGG